jgi:hypothetical protein
MDLLFGETIDTLREAGGVLRNEIEWRAKARSSDEGNLRRLREAARSFQVLAHTLVVTMLFYPDVPEALRQEVEGFVDSFSDMVDHLEAMLAWDPHVT